MQKKLCFKRIFLKKIYADIFESAISEDKSVSKKRWDVWQRKVVDLKKKPDYK